MLKTEILMNDNKIISDKIYDVDKIYAFLDNSFENHGLVKISKGIYKDVGGKDDFSHMWIIIMRLLEKD